MPEDLTIPDTTVPRRGAVLAVAGIVALLFAITIALWAHYGTAVFYEMIVAGIAACL